MYWMWICTVFQNMFLRTPLSQVGNGCPWTKEFYKWRKYWKSINQWINQSIIFLLSVIYVFLAESLRTSNVYIGNLQEAHVVHSISLKSLFRECASGTKKVLCECVWHEWTNEWTLQMCTAGVLCREKKLLGSIYSSWRWSNGKYLWNIDYAKATIYQVPTMC